MPAPTSPLINSSFNHPSTYDSDETAMAADAQSQSQWLFTEEELLLAPSIVDGGLAPEKERENRGKGVNFILQAGIMLKLPQITLATASVFLHRFYMRYSMVDSPTRGPGYHYYSMAATCLFLATKVEENCRKMKELVIACVRVAQKDPEKTVDEQDKEYWRWRDNILHSEDILLEALCFDLSLEAPHKTLFELVVQFHVEKNKRLRNSAWTFVNDSYVTMLCLLFPSRIIAASAFYAATKHAGAAFPDDEMGRPWWHSIGVDIGDIQRACNCMAEMYKQVPAKAGRDGIHYERTPEIKDMSDITRAPGPASTSQASQNGGDEPSDQSHAKGGGGTGSAGTGVSPSSDLDRMKSVKMVNGASSEGASPHKRRRLDDESDGPGTGTATAGPSQTTTLNETSQQTTTTDFDMSGSSHPAAKHLDPDNVSEEGEVES